MKPCYLYNGNFIHGKTVFIFCSALLDVILTGSSRRISDTLNVDTGISDFHHLVGFSTKLQIPRSDKSMISYRSYKHFDELSFKNYMQTIPYHVGEVFDDIDDSYWFTQKLISSVIDKHTPMKRRKAIKTPVPFMNNQLRKSCHRKAMLHNRYFKNGRQKKDWELFRRIRNSTTKLKAKSIKNILTANVTKCISINPSYFGIQSSLSYVIKVYRKMNAECLT